MADKPDTFFRWLGRQVGHVKRAVSVKEKVVYESECVEEVDHPTDPNLKLRRSTKDQIIDQRDP